MKQPNHPSDAVLLGYTDTPLKAPVRAFDETFSVFTLLAETFFGARPTPPPGPQRPNDPITRSPAGNS
jgi:hypothetical protein